MANNLPFYIAIAILTVIFWSTFTNKLSNKEFAKECETQKHGTVFYEYDSFMIVCVRGEKIN